MNETGHVKMGRRVKRWKMVTVPTDTLANSKVIAGRPANADLSTATLIGKRRELLKMGKAELKRSQKTWTRECYQQHGRRACIP